MEGVAERPWLRGGPPRGHPCSQRQPGWRLPGRGGALQRRTSAHAPQDHAGGSSVVHLAWPLEASSGTGPLLRHGPGPPAHDCTLGRQLPNRRTLTLGAEELLSSIDCPPALSLPRAFLPTRGTMTHLFCRTRCSHRSHRSMTKRSCLLVPTCQRSRQQRGRRSWPRKRIAPYPCDDVGCSQTYTKSPPPKAHL